jgi:hypothetical protein
MAKYICRYVAFSLIKKTDEVSKWGNGETSSKKTFFNHLGTHCILRFNTIATPLD